MEIPARIEQAVNDAVAEQLGKELGERGLLLAADRLAAAQADAAELGARLLACVIDSCYPITERGGQSLVLEFESEAEAARVEAALAFGAATASVLTPGPRDALLLCAMFNLATGLIDGVCDGDAATGGQLLRLLQRRDLAGAAEGRRSRGWLRAELPPPLLADPAVAFAADLLEAFFEAVHAVYPDDLRLPLRRRLGVQLEAALEAERQSVEWSAGPTSRERLIECSRLTSVIPFQIMEALAGGDQARTEPTAGTLLGEAMWRIDDLVDLCQDARSGALNGVLLAATEEPWQPGERDPCAVLERLLASTDIACAAARAAENLLAGLQLASGDRGAPQDRLRNRSFLYFSQRYAGIA